MKYDLVRTNAVRNTVLYIVSANRLRGLSLEPKDRNFVLSAVKRAFSRSDLRKSVLVAALSKRKGPKGGKMAEMADVAVKAPGGSTKVIQEAHLVLYHTICNLIEAHYFPELR